MWVERSGRLPREGTKMSSLYGQILLWCGFLGAAVMAVSQPEGDYFLPNAEVTPNINDRVVVRFKLQGEEDARQVSGRLKKLDEMSVAFEFTKVNPETKEKATETLTVPNENVIWARTLVSADPWRKINWLLFSIFASVGWVGVVLLRIAKVSGRAKSIDKQADLLGVVATLREATAGVKELDENLPLLSCEEVLQIIDERLAPKLTSFADDRQVLADQLGISAYTQIMTEFASGERYLNRAWSAAADGYVDEVVTAVGNAKTFLNDAISIAQEIVTQNDLVKFRNSPPT